MEILKEIPGFKGFFVSRSGVVLNSRGRLIKSYSCNGYSRVNVTRDDGKRVGVDAHRLVVMAFVGPIPAGMWVNHKNGIKHDNRVENLEVDTPRHNRLHAKHVLGRKCQPLGESNGNNKLSKRQMESIRALIAKGVSQRKIAARFKVTQPCISDIKRGRCWK